MLIESTLYNDRVKFLNCLESCNILTANALVESHIDNCNSLFRSVSTIDLCRLQCIETSIQTSVFKPVELLLIPPTTHISLL